MLRTSVLGRLSGALCDAMLQTSGSALVLEKIERENLFVVPLDTSRHWYRYHQLFGELLRTELRRSEPDLIADLHRRAATWFEAEGLVDEAVRERRGAALRRLTASLRARSRQHLRGYGAGGMRCPCAEVPGWRIVLWPSLRLCMGSRADFWCSSCRINSCLAS